MSQESLAWLNQNVLIGHTDARGRAWHYRASSQGAEPNHYPGAIPVEEVRRRLFPWHAEMGQATVTWTTGGQNTDEHWFPVGRADTGAVFGYFAEGYQIHQYQDWLIDKVGQVLDGGLSIGSAGLLKDGAQAWVSIEVPENVTTPEGVVFRPNLVAATSHDGSLATTYKRTITNVVCDNTMSAALRGPGKVFKFRHSRNSGKNAFRALHAREALDLVQQLGETYAAEVADLCQVSVSDAAIREFLQAYVPEQNTKRSRTMAERKRADMLRLWRFDDRVSPWRGTAWGALQMVNTYTHHEATVRGSGRAERNMSRALTSKVESLDQGVLDTLDQVLVHA